MSETQINGKTRQLGHRGTHAAVAAVCGSRPPGEVIMRAGREWVHVAGREMDNCVRRELAQMVAGEKQWTPAVMALTLALGQTDVGRANSSPGSISMRSLKVTQKRLCSGRPR
ncbi:unnamed protein product [Arctogadus glacialis]